MKTLTEQISAVKRELSMRISVYPRRVMEGKMLPEFAAHQIDCMQAVLETLEALNKHRGPQLDFLNVTNTTQPKTPT